MQFFLNLLPFGLALAVSAGLTYWMVTADWKWAVDLPGERSLHTRPVPRTGGIGLFAGVLVSGAFVSLKGSQWPWLEPIIACALCAISLVDDRRGLSVAVRLSAHLGAALLFLVCVLVDGRGQLANLPAWLWLPLAFLTIVAMSNFYNFMDGANGMAGGMTLIGFGAFTAAAITTQPGLAALCAALAGAALGFLLFNWPGRIFMGDCGSVPLGFLAASIGVSGWLAGAWAFWFPAIVFAPFIVDASVTLLRRFWRGDRIWQAHREHYYQRAVRMGLSHGRVAMWEYVLMVACAAAALALPGFDAAGQALIFATIGLLFMLVMVVIDVRWRRHLAQHPY